MGLLRDGTAIEKGILSIAVAAAMGISLIGCSPAAQQPSATTPASSNSASSAQSGSSSESTSEEASSITSESLNASDYEIYSVIRNFSDGYSNVWAHPLSAGSNASNELYFVDTDGDMTKWPYEETNISNVYEGTVLASLNPGERRMNLSGGSTAVKADSIVSIDGTVIWSIEDDGEKAAEQFGFAEDLVEISSPFETYGGSNNYSVGESEEQEYKGYMPVIFTVESFDYAGDYIGMLDHTGRWVVEPTKSYDWYNDNEYYCSFQTFTLDYATGKVSYFTEDESDKQDELESRLEFEGFLAAHDGLIFSEEDKHIPFERDTQGFYDASGKLIIDTSDYDFYESWPYPYFKDGYCMLSISNAQGSEYHVVIDTTGKEMSKPVKIGSHGELSEGAFFDEDYRCFKDVRFEQIGTIDGGDAYEFSDGRAWILDGQSWKCIDSKGTVVF